LVRAKVERTLCYEENMGGKTKNTRKRGVWVKSTFFTWLEKKQGGSTLSATAREAEGTQKRMWAKGWGEKMRGGVNCIWKNRLYDAGE